MRRNFCIVLSIILFVLSGCYFDVLNNPQSDYDALRSAAGSFDAARYDQVLDFGPYLRSMDADPVKKAQLDAQLKKNIAQYDFNESNAPSTAATESTFTFDGGTKVFLGYDIKEGYYLKAYTLRSIGNNVEIWVANTIKFPDDRPEPIITQEQVDLMRDEYDSVIHNTMHDFFGTPDSRTGKDAVLIQWGYFPQGYYDSADGIERLIVLVDNVRDEMYYDKTYPFYLMGFFSPTIESYCDRNIVTLDTLAWDKRLRNYFSTLAHELQHLIHSDNDSDEENWVNEGMSDFAQYLCGYGHAMGHVNFFLDHPENSLVDWDEHYSAPTGPETLADYGQAYLFTLYLNDHFGKEFIRSFALDKDNGITSLEKLLLQVSVVSSKDEDADDDDEEDNTILTFEKIFRRFNIALAIDSYHPGDRIYEFKSIDVKINYTSALTFDKDGVPAWGSDFKVLVDPKKIHKIIFDGIDFLPIPWQNANDPFNASNKVLWGNSSNLAQNHIVFQADLTGKTSATLVFDNYYDIEEQWDFGMVQVSTDNGKTWISLANANTRADIVAEGHPDIKANLPGFTGRLTTWKEEKFDLSPYAGKPIFIRFNYMTDWGTLQAGWYVDNIRIPEIGLSNSCDNLDEFLSMDQLLKIPVEYAVSFVNKRSTSFAGKLLYKVLNIKPFALSTKDTVKLAEFLTKGDTYMVVWYAAPIGKKGYVPFTYQIINKHDD